MVSTPTPLIAISCSWAVGVLQDAGGQVRLAHPLGVKRFAYRRVKNDVRDAANLADLLCMDRLPEGWIAPPVVRELRETVRYRAKLVAWCSELKASVHGVLAKQGGTRGEGSVRRQRSAMVEHGVPALASAPRRISSRSGTAADGRTPGRRPSGG